MRYPSNKIITLLDEILDSIRPLIRMLHIRISWKNYHTCSYLSVTCHHSNRKYPYQIFDFLVHLYNAKKHYKGSHLYGV